MDKGYVHVLTGNGKGKTTAAIGLAIRAAGAGFKIFFGQFVKKGEYSEIIALKRFSDVITVEQFGLGRFTDKKPKLEDIQAARKGIERVKHVMASGEYDMVVLDEANVAVKLGLFPLQELIDLIVTKPPRLELVITGRYASPRVIEMADMATELRARKHYYDNGTKARVGIEM
jgi:cob(I)alamin adenosyltransferase